MIFLLYKSSYSLSFLKIVIFVIHRLLSIICIRFKLNEIRRIMINNGSNKINDTSWFRLRISCDSKYIDVDFITTCSDLNTIEYISTYNDDMNVDDDNSPLATMKKYLNTLKKNERVKVIGNDDSDEQQAGPSQSMANKSISGIRK